VWVEYVYHLSHAFSTVAKSCLKMQRLSIVDKVDNSTRRPIFETVFDGCEITREIPMRSISFLENAWRELRFFRKNYTDTIVFIFGCDSCFDELIDDGMTS
jgi:hypothetical protein